MDEDCVMTDLSNRDSATKQRLAAGGAIAIGALLLVGLTWSIWSAAKPADKLREGEFYTDVGRGDARRGGGAGGMTFNFQARNAQPPTNTGVRPGNRSVTVRVPAAECIISTASNPPTFRFVLTPLPVEGEDRAVLLLRNRLLSDNAMSESLKVTAEQLQALRDMGQGIEMITTPDDEPAMRELFAAYQSAPENARAESSKRLEEKLAEIAAKNTEPTRKALAERAAKVREILRPEQYSANPAPRAAQPAEQPAVRPQTAPAN
jgi:hypothetical protein